MSPTDVGLSIDSIQVPGRVGLSLKRRWEAVAIPLALALLVAYRQGEMKCNGRMGEDQATLMKRVAADDVKGVETPPRWPRRRCLWFLCLEVLCEMWAFHRMDARRP